MPTIRTDALTNLERAKLFMGVVSDRYDGLITMLINQATGFINGYVGRALKSTTYSDEEYDGHGDYQLFLKQFPVTAVSALQYNNAVDNSDDWQTFATTDYFWYENGTIKLQRSTFFDRPEGRAFLNRLQRYRVTYTAGYLIDFDNEEDTSKHTLPMEIEYVCQSLVAGIFNTRNAQGYSATKLGDQSITMKKLLFGDAEIKDILDKYATPNI